MLNSTLTVEKDKANSHQGLGWQYFTDYVIKVLNLSEKPIVFILWGKPAQEKAKMRKTLILDCDGVLYPTSQLSLRDFVSAR